MSKQFGTSSELVPWNSPGSDLLIGVFSCDSPTSLSSNTIDLGTTLTLLHSTLISRKSKRYHPPTPKQSEASKSAMPGPELATIPSNSPLFRFTSFEAPPFRFPCYAIRSEASSMLHTNITFHVLYENLDSAGAERFLRIARKHTSEPSQQVAMKPLMSLTSIPNQGNLELWLRRVHYGIMPPTALCMHHPLSPFRVSTMRCHSPVNERRSSYAVESNRTQARGIDIAAGCHGMSEATRIHGPTETFRAKSRPKPAAASTTGNQAPLAATTMNDRQGQQYDHTTVVLDYRKQRSQDSRPAACYLLAPSCHVEGNAQYLRIRLAAMALQPIIVAPHATTAAMSSRSSKLKGGRAAWDEAFA
ncbi:hypothetical protein Q7P37_008894 [Cladosporium fusiforme]